MAIRLKPTARGFLRGEFIDNPVDGNVCSIQQSSALLHDEAGYYLWLGVNDPKPKQFPGDGTGWHDYPLPENVQCTTRMHLSRKTAAALIPLLQRYVRQGDLNPPKHQWVRDDPRWPSLSGLTFCVVCGVVQRGDGRNKACSGITPRITLRQADGAPEADAAVRKDSR